MFLAKVNDQDFFAFRYMLTWGFPSGSVVKKPACNAGDAGSIPGWGRSPGGGNGNLLGESHEQRSLAGCTPQKS